MRVMGFVFALITSFVAAAEPKSYGSALVLEVTSIYDGDTFRANIRDWPAMIGERISIRVSGVDTPELRGKCEKEKLLARRAKQHTVAMLRAGNVIQLENIQRGKYFRIVADVYVDGESLSQSLIDANLGVAYFGSTKAKDWCE